MSRLLLCPHCQRHVRQDEHVCPFCGDALSFAPQPRERRGSALTRAALLGVTVLTSIAGGGCDDDDDDDEDEAPLPQPAYGVPVDDGGSGPDTDGGQMIQPAYGVPIDDGGLPQPAYGVPIEPDGGRDNMAQPAYGVPIDG